MNTDQIIYCQKVTHRLAGEINGPDPDLVFCVNGPPVGYQRVGAKHHTPKRTRDYMNHVKACVGLARTGRVSAMSVQASIWPLCELVFVDVWMYFPKTSNGNHPDADNVQKAIHDGAAGLLWSAGSKGAKDDRHVMGRCQGMEYEHAHPRVDVAVTRYSLVRDYQRANGIDPLAGLHA